MFIFFFCLWIIFNGAFTLEIALFGVGVSALIYLFICKFMDFSIKKDIAYMRTVPVFLEYVAVLIWEIIKANLVMMKYIIIKQEYELHPVIFKINTAIKNRAVRTLLANAITLTPGTISVSMEEDCIVIHAVDEALAVEDDGNFIFERILLKMERRLEK